MKQAHVGNSILAFLIPLLLLQGCQQGGLEKESRSSSNYEIIKGEALNAMLDSIWISEQEPIRLRDSLGRVHGFESVEYHRQNDIYHEAHRLNEIKIVSLLENQAWPSRSEVGEEGHLTICNVLQHSSEELRTKFLPMMRKAVVEQELAPRLLARAEDRLATDRGDLQIYGGQIKYYPESQSFDVWPIFDPENVDKRRSEIGLPPIAEFLASRRNPLEWNLEDQIKRTNAFEAAKAEN